MKLWGGGGGGGGRVRPTSIPSNGNGRILIIPSKGPGNCFVQGYLADIPVSFVVDTGADVTVVRSDVWEGTEGGELDAWEGRERLIDASGYPMRVMGMKVTSLRLGDGEFTHPVIVVEGSPMEALHLWRHFTYGGTSGNGFYLTKWLHVRPRCRMAAC